MSNMLNNYKIFTFIKLFIIKQINTFTFSRWYFPLFTNLIDMTLVNAHVLYILANEKIPLLDFRRNIARTYLSLASVSNPKNSGGPSLPKLSTKRVLETVRRDSIGHYIEKQLKESRGNVESASQM